MCFGWCVLLGVDQTINWLIKSRTRKGGDASFPIDDFGLFSLKKIKERLIYKLAAGECPIIEGCIAKVR